MTYEQYTNGNGVDRSAREIQHDLGQIRGEIDHTLDALSQQLSPGQLVNHALDAFKGGGGGDLMRNLTRSIQDNPLPLAMIAAGFGYLMISDRNRRRSDDPFAGRGGSGDGYDFEPIGSYDERGSGVSQKLSEGADRVKEGGRHVRDKVSHLREGMHDQGIAQPQLGQAREQARAAKDWTSGLVEEQPLVLAGLGLALGAAAAALVPMSRKEHRLMGDAGGRLRDQAKAVASDAGDKAKSIAGNVAQAAKDAAQQEAHEQADEQGVNVFGDASASVGAAAASATEYEPPEAVPTSGVGAQLHESALPRRMEQPRATYAPNDPVTPQHLQDPASRASGTPRPVTLNYPPGTVPKL